MSPSRAALSAFLLILAVPAVCSGVELNYFGSFDGVLEVEDPTGSKWNEIYPNLRNGPYTILDWKDCGDDVLSFSDTLSMEHSALGVSCHQVVDVTITLELKLAPDDSVVYIWNWDWLNGGEPLIQPANTWWNELRPGFGSVHHIDDWTDNGSGVLDSSDLVVVDGAGQFLVEGVRTGMVTEPVRECAIDVSTWGEIKSLYR